MYTRAAISNLKFPLELKKDQLDTVDAWLSNGFRGSIIYSVGTGKTEIAFECAKKAANATAKCFSSYFNILYLVPRIVLVNHNLERLLNYGIPEEHIGVYFGGRKQIQEITISTYNSVINNLDLVRTSDMVIFDEMHLISNTAKTFSKIFDVIVEDHNKAILGLTAAIDKKDSIYNTIMTILPPVKKYTIKDAVDEDRLSRPIIIPLKVKLNDKEQKLYDCCSVKIKNISHRVKKYDVKSMSLLLTRSGHVEGLVKAWFVSVRKRKAVLSCATNKLSAAVDLIRKKHPNERVMVFSDTLDSINKLKSRLESQGIKAMVIDSNMNSIRRQMILSKWGRDFYPLLSVYTLEIGYDVPQVGIKIILTSTSNMNQAIQRIGRVLRRYDEKDTALIYLVYVSDTKDDNILAVIEQVEKMTGRKEEAISVAAVANGVNRCIIKADSLT
ncbi:MAG TPA: DEAD/DEAH box helicase family protein [Nitrososphaeraceae archaeon]|jgi:superfamily II DNA or RNA helicase|nr:DEAD/DEAH box helicase family protein [Nitrososphaeraceae archaeon]